MKRKKAQVPRLRSKSPGELAATDNAMLSDIPLGPLMLHAGLGRGTMVVLLARGDNCLQSTALRAVSASAMEAF